MIVILGVKYITEKEASTRYGYSLSWFQRQRHFKKKPSFVKLQGTGKVYYPMEDTDLWFKENLVKEY